MKKMILSAITILTIGFANAQDDVKRVTLNLGLPTGDAGKSFSFNFGADFTYMVEAATDFKVGGSIGYSAFTGKTITNNIPGFGTFETKIETFSFIPVAATGEYSFDKFYIGADLGYAIAVSPSGAKGGLFYQPKVGYTFDALNVSLGYRGISADGGTVSAVNLGVGYKF